MLALCTAQGKATGAYSSTFTMTGCGECAATDVASAYFLNSSGSPVSGSDSATQIFYTDAAKANQAFSWYNFKYLLSTALTNWLANPIANPTTEPLWTVNITIQPSDSSGNVQPGTIEKPVFADGLPSTLFATDTHPGDVHQGWGILTDPVYNCYKWKVYSASRADTGFGTVQSCWGSSAIGSGDWGYYGTYALIRPISNTNSSTTVPVGSLPVNNSLDTTQVNITLSSHVGTFSNGDSVSGSTSGATGKVTGGGNTRGGASPISVMSVVGAFAVGETLNDTTSGAHGVIASTQVTVGIPPAGIFGGQNGLVGANTLTGGSGGNLGNGTVTGGSGGNLSSGTVTGGSGGNIASTTILNSNIANLTITYVQIANVTIQSGQVASQTLLGSNMQNGTVQAAQIGADTVTGGSGGNIALGTVTGASNLAASTVIAANYAAGSVSSTTVASNTLTGGSGGNLASTTVMGSNIGALTVTNTNIVGMAADKLALAANTVTVGITGGATVQITSSEVTIEGTVLAATGVSSPNFESVSGSYTFEAYYSQVSVSNSSTGAGFVANTGEVSISDGMHVSILAPTSLQVNNLSGTSHTVNITGGFTVDGGGTTYHNLVFTCGVLTSYS
jgi:hypothetical protein